MNYDKQLKKAAKSRYGSMRQFAIQNGHTPANIKKQILFNVDKLNRLLKPLNLKIRIDETGRFS
jgi:hypothetical protein